MTNTISTYDITELKIDPKSTLDACSKRQVCQGCGKNFKFFCYHCHELLGELQGKIPKIKLPFKLDVIKHPNELDGKSTAIHAKLIAPDDVAILEFSENLLDSIDSDRAVLLFPGPDAHYIADVDPTTYDQAYVIDGTWAQAKSMVNNNTRLQRMRRVTIKPRKTRFWRYQSFDESYLATIEAIYFLYRDSVGDDYNGEYDALMYFYKYFYDMIQGEYVVAPHKRFNTKHQKNYISYESATPSPNPRPYKRDTSAKIDFNFDNLPIGDIIESMTSKGFQD